MPKPHRTYANIAKVESRDKIYFHSAETGRIYERQPKYK